jgi:hypothetical protein
MSLNSTISLKNEMNEEKVGNLNQIISEEENYNLKEENKKKIISFYSKFKYLCCKHKMGNLRKNHIDILVKKVKIKLFKGIHEAIKLCLNININRLPQNFILNIKIAFNQKYLYKTISEIYSEYSILPPLKEILFENKIIKKDKLEIFILLMNSCLMNIIKIYLMSNLFLYDKKKLEKKSGINDVILFDFVANNICDYFQYSEILNKKEDSSKNITINTINSDINVNDKFRNNINLDKDNNNK